MTRVEMLLRLFLLVVALCASVAYSIEALDFPVLSRYGPLFAGVLASVLLLVAVVREVVRLRRERRTGLAVQSRTMEDSADRNVTVERLARDAVYVGWILGFLAALWLVGMFVAGPLFVGLFLTVDAGSGRRFAAVSAAGVLAALWAFEAIGMRLPRGLLTRLLG